MKNAKTKITSIMPESIAEELEILPGSLLISINEQQLDDILDYQFLEANEEINLVIETPGNELIEYEIEKDIYEPLGLEFDSPVFDKLKTCCMDCSFCFVKQMPKGLRQSLYYRDDDYRLSFLNGNFITCSNLSEKDIKKIISYRLSPLYFSLHTVSLDIREKLLGDKNNRILETIDILEKENIEIHVQIVLCPGINDGDELIKSIKYCLSRKNIISIGIVPVGITDFLPEIYTKDIRKFSKNELLKVIEHINSFKTDKVFLSDEFYLSTDTEIPEIDYYTDFPQIENGIGMVRTFMDDLYSFKIDKKSNYLILTGTLFGNYLKKQLPDNFHVKSVKNQFFGESVTVSGLLTGSDISRELNEIQDLNSYEKIIISAEMINEDGLFLDNLSLETIERDFGISITCGYFLSDCF
ncbi:DUF512 domain-containing protein [bacterium]|nr:DUF512 domain-containing protein [bacterium]